MMDALQHEDPEVRSAIVSNLLVGGGPVDDTLVVLGIAFADPDSRVRRLCLLALDKAGHALSRAEADSLERRVDQGNAHAAVRLVLLGYYALPSTMFQWARVARQRHIMWIIEHCPEVAVQGPSFHLDGTTETEAVEQAKALWLRQVAGRPNEGNVLANAAGFFCMHDSNLSEALLKRAQALEPQNPEWFRRLGSHYSLRMLRETGDARRKAASQAMAEFERCPRQQGGRGVQLRMLVRLARVALEAGELEKARSYAGDLLQGCERGEELPNDNSGAFFYGHFVLGRLAVLAGDIGEAKSHLLESANTRGSPVLRSYGPDMTLAKELLECGEREAVIEFLKLCTKFWNTNNHQAEQWIYAIAHGETPDFKYHLK